MSVAWTRPPRQRRCQSISGIVPEGHVVCPAAPTHGENYQTLHASCLLCRLYSAGPVAYANSGRGASIPYSACVEIVRCTGIKKTETKTWCWLFSRLRGFGENIRSFLPRLRFLFFFLYFFFSFFLFGVEISSRTLIRSTFSAKISPQWLSELRWLWPNVP